MLGGGMGPGQGLEGTSIQSMQNGSDPALLGPIQRSGKISSTARGEGGASHITGSQWTERQGGQPGGVGLDGPTNSLIQSIMGPQGSSPQAARTGKGSPSKGPGDFDHSTMHNSSLM